MDQIYNGMLGMVQVAAEKPQDASAPAENSGQTQASHFQKLLESRRTEAPGGVDGQAGTAAEKEAGEQGSGEPAEIPGDLDLELQRMAWAALFLAQNPAEPLEQADIPAENMAVQSPDALLAPKEAGAAGTQEPSAAAAEAEGVMTELPVRLPEQDIPQGETREAAARNPSGNGKPGVALQTEDFKQADDPVERLAYGSETPVFQEVRDIPVKVGEAGVMEQAGGGQPVEIQLSEKLTEALQSGETKVELQLEPENLGRVHVEMTWDQNGGLHVSMYAEHSHTRSLLEREMPGLQYLLSRNTQQEVRVEVPRQQESQQQNFYDGRNGGQNGRQPQEQRHSQPQNGQDFLHQLRLGLVTLDE